MAGGPIAVFASKIVKSTSVHECTHKFPHKVILHPYNRVIWGTYLFHYILSRVTRIHIQENLGIKRRWNPESETLEDTTSTVCDRIQKPAMEAAVP